MDVREMRNEALGKRVVKALESKNLRRTSKQEVIYDYECLK